MSEGSHRPRDSALITTTGASDNDRLDPSVWKIAAVVSRITLSDGLVIAAFDGLPSSASRLP